MTPTVDVGNLPNRFLDTMKVMKTRRRRLGWTLSGILVWGTISGLTCSATPLLNETSGGQIETVKTSEATATAPEKAPLAAAFEAATAAAQLAQSATTADDWSDVASVWGEAIQSLQAVPTDSPQWLFAQRKAREYQENQQVALQRVEAAGILPVFPTLGTDVLDEQIAVYLSYVATFGTPDILVVGSSRALQGLNPQILQQQLAQQGLESQTVYNFAVNGATAQVMSFILRQLLTPEQMPRIIVWAGGSRAFNSGRFDRTFAKILESPGYTAIRSGDRPQIGWINGEEVADAEKADRIPTTSINGYGFLEVSDVYDPDTYYRDFPRVPGLYDDDYQRFDLDGVQTVSFRAIAGFARANDIPLVFVNLPLSDDYLDETRFFYEQQFQQFLASEAKSGGFTVIDLLQAWPNRNNIFADPSHLNRFGAAQVATRIAADPSIPWNILEDGDEEPSADGVIAPDSKPPTDEAASENSALSE